MSKWQRMPWPLSAKIKNSTLILSRMESHKRERSYCFNLFALWFNLVTTEMSSPPINHLHTLVDCQLMRPTHWAVSDFLVNSMRFVSIKDFNLLRCLLHLFSPGYGLLFNFGFFLGVDLLILCTLVC